jgi:hypothetical protein
MSLVLTVEAPELSLKRLTSDIKVLDEERAEFLSDSDGD